MKKLATESIAPADLDLHRPVPQNRTTEAELTQPADHRDLAKARLRELAAKAKIGDVVSPAIDDFKESQSTLHRKGDPGK